jgi:hypothetical protein
MKSKKIYLLSLIGIFAFLSLIFNLPTRAQDHNISVSAIVPPTGSDFQFSYADDGQTTVPQGTTLSYTITYGAQSSAGVNTTTTLVADWSDDLAPDSSHVLDYVIGSASNGYGGATPVVNLTDRTITWTISSLPAGTTNQTVTFQLKTNSNYTGASAVNFTTRAKMSNEYTTMTDQTITQTYQFDAALVTPTPTPTMTPTPTPTPSTSSGPTATPTPSASSGSNSAAAGPTTYNLQPTTSPLKITGVSFTGITESTAKIEVTTNKLAILSIRFGTSPTALTQTLTTSGYHLLNAATFDNLSPAKTYYFQITATGQDGQSALSEIFTFDTATVSEELPSKSIAVLTTNGTVVFSRAIDKTITTFPFVILPTHTAYELTYTFLQPTDFTSVEALLKDKNGVIIQRVHMSEMSKDAFTARLNSFDRGMYGLYVQTNDSKGNLVEQKIADIKVVNPLSVYEKDAQTPLGDARIELFYYNAKTKKYEKVTPELFGNIKNPAYTDKYGRLITILPPGKYRAQASALFFEKSSVDFTLGREDGQEYPTIYLKKAPFNLFALFNFLKDLWIDTLHVILIFINPLFSSDRFFNIFAALIVACLIGLGFLFFTFKSHISFRHLPRFFIFHLRRNKKTYLFGTIINEHKEKLSRARVEIIDPTTNIVLAHMQTNRAGRFYINNTFGEQELRLLATKDGYAPLSTELSTETDLSPEGVLMQLQSITTPEYSFLKMLLYGLEHSAGSLFEMILLVSIIIEVMFFSLYGLAKTLPFFILSLANIMLWIFFLREKRKG